MKSIRNPGIWILIAVACAGCASPYMAHRGRDVKDIFTLTAGIGGGAKARAGFLQAGLFLNGAEAGLRGGEMVSGSIFKETESGLPATADGLYFAYGLETFNGGPLAAERGKAFHAGTLCFVTVPVPERWCVGKESKRSSGKHARYAPVPYLTQLEAAVGLGVTVRAGVNPGEALDFLLGWAGIDLFDDDYNTEQTL